MHIIHREHYYTWNSTRATLILVAILSTFVLSISTVIRRYDYFYEPNQLTFGLPFPTWILFVLMFIVTLGIFYFDLYKHHSIPIALFLTGGWSNAMERILFGSATDYIPFFDGYINIADIMIWGGLVWLNVMLWLFPERDRLADIADQHAAELKHAAETTSKTTKKKSKSIKAKNKK